MTILFCVAAGPRIGYGHLMRAVALARWMDVPCRVVLRGGAAARAVAVRAGARLLDAPLGRVLERRAWQGVVVDDPHEPRAASVVRCARRAGLAVASVHDLALAPVASDLAIDGSLVASMPLPASRALRGPRFAILDPGLRQLTRVTPRPRRVVISLGGGATARAADCVALRLHAARPDLEVFVTTAFGRHGAITPACDGTYFLGPGVHRVAPGPGFRRLLASACVAVTGAGVTLYEAAALGVPVVPVAVVRAQLPTARGFAARGLVCSSRAHTLDHGVGVRVIVADVLAALGNLTRARRVSMRARRAVDGQGGARVARELEALFALGRAPARSRA